MAKYALFLLALLSVSDVVFIIWLSWEAVYSIALSLPICLFVLYLRALSVDFWLWLKLNNLKNILALKWNFHWFMQALIFLHDIQVPLKCQIGTDIGDLEWLWTT